MSGLISYGDKEILVESKTTEQIVDGFLSWYKKHNGESNDFILRVSKENFLSLNDSGLIKKFKSRDGYLFGVYKGIKTEARL